MYFTFHLSRTEVRLMARFVTFDCPSCSAPVKTPDDSTVVHCDYCGNNLMVPESLRSTPPPSQFGHTIVIHTSTGTHTFPSAQPIHASIPTGRKVRFNRGCGLLLVLFIITVVVAPIGAAAWGIMSAINPRFLEEITGTAFARKELSFGGKGRGPGLFDNPVDLTTDKAGDIYVLEGTTGRVQRFDKSGRYLNAWVVEGGSNYSAIAADRETGEIYVVSDPKIFKYDGVSGDLLGVPAEKGSAFFATRDLAVFPNGDLLTFVSGGNSEDLVRLDPDGQEVSRYERAVSKVYGAGKVAPAPWNVKLATDSSERMLVLNKSAGLHAEVLIYKPDGQYERRFGDQGGRFTFANDLAVDSKGRIYVSDMHGVDAFESAGKSLGSIDIPFGSVSAIAVTADDDLLILSQNQEVLRYKIR